MDVPELRRQVVLNLIKSKFDGSQAAFAAVARISPSYLTRMLSAPGHPGHKRIGEDKALELEAIAELGLPAGALLDPQPAGRADFVVTTETRHLVLEVKASEPGQLVLALAQLLAFVPEADRDALSRKLAAFALAPDSEALRQSLLAGLKSPGPEKKALGAPIAAEHAADLERLSREAEQQHAQPAKKQRRRASGQ